jgi:hypothetical protein
LDAYLPGEENSNGSMPDHDNIRGTDYYKRFDSDSESDTDEEETPV